MLSKSTSNNTKCSHDHHHTHKHGNSYGQSVRNISLALAINATFAIIELVGGYLTKSTAIQADAVHDLGDTAVLMGALLLQFVAQIPPSTNFSFGLRRFSLLSGVISSLILCGGSIVILIASLARFSNPETPHLDGMLGLAILGVVVNGIAAWTIGHGHTHNEKALSWHMIEDLMGWIAVLISSLIMRFGICLGSILHSRCLSRFWLFLVESRPMVRNKTASSSCA